MIPTKKPYSTETIHSLLSVAIDAKKSKKDNLDTHLNNLFKLVRNSCLESIKNRVFDKKDYHSNADYLKAYSICEIIEKNMQLENKKFSAQFIENKITDFTYPYYLDVSPTNYNELEDHLKDILGGNPYNIARQQIADSKKEHLPEYAAYIALTKPVRDKFFASNKDLIKQIDSILCTTIEISDDLPNKKMNSEQVAKPSKIKM